MKCVYNSCDGAGSALSGQESVTLELFCICVNFFLMYSSVFIKNVFWKYKINFESLHIIKQEVHINPENHCRPINLYPVTTCHVYVYNSKLFLN